MDAPHERSRRSIDQGQQNIYQPTATTTRRRKPDQSTMSPIEATVTKLVVAAKQLLDGLTRWANLRMTEEQVSDVFVQLATQFNLACQSFHEAGIDTSDLANIPDDLRNCLETALGEDPSPISLDQYLPRVKEIIISLLQGLRIRQNLYREQYEAKTGRLQTPPPPAHSSPSTPSTPPTPTPPLPPQVSPELPQQVLPGATPRTRPIASQFRQPSNGVNGPQESLAVGGGANVGGYSSPRYQNLSTASPPAISISSPQDESATLASLRKRDAITRRASSRRHSQRFSTLVEQNTIPVPRKPHPMSDSSLMSTYPGYLSTMGSSPLANPYLTPPQGEVPSVPTLKHDHLPTIPGPPTPGNKEDLGSMPLPPEIPVPQPPSGTQNQPTLSTPATPSVSVISLTEGVNDATKPTLDGSSDYLPTPTNPPTVTSTSESEISQSLATVLPEAIVAEPIDASLTLFLQVGKSVKKTKYEGELTHSGLRMLFMEKFQYNPGQEDFPTIYVKDPQTNIHYELESLTDVKQNAFLSLNVDDLENIQRKMDQGFASLTKELHDIKKAQEAMEQARQKAAASAAAAAVVAASIQPERSTSSTTPEGSAAFRSVVQKVLTKNKTNSLTASPPGESKISAEDLKSHYNEVQTLRRDLGVVRQLYTELQNETKSMLGNLAGYTNQMKKQAQETPTSARVFIESGKVKLDKKSEDLTNKIEDLQDVVEDMKVNVTQRRGKPSESSLAFVDKQCGEIQKEIEELSDYIQTLRPSWKKTWEVELQTIVKEQMFLKEQEALLEDLKEDRSSLLQTLGNLKKLLELQAKNGSGQRNKEYFFHPVVDENFEGLKTVLEEMKMIEPDSDKRLKAMAQMEKLRHIELSNRIDEFEEELTTFVGASKLRKTGGASEVERLRQQRDSENLKAMFGASKGAEQTTHNNDDNGGDNVSETQEVL
ncbi:Bud site selection protein 6 [Mortierella sp. AD011]|nr:Bud site selection protein 6 [Mortierella sp. AD010]KAF9380765.1 Bud site selection protein 6 [Mortierella sp. AD011]